MRIIAMFITAACVLFLIKVRWPKKKSIQHIIIMYRSERATSLLYGGSPGARMDAILLERLYQHCLHRVLNIHCGDVFKNLEVLQKAEITTVETSRLRMECYRLLKI